MGKGEKRSSSNGRAGVSGKKKAKCEPTQPDIRDYFSSSKYITTPAQTGVNQLHPVAVATLAHVRSDLQGNAENLAFEDFSSGEDSSDEAAQSESGEVEADFDEASFIDAGLCHSGISQAKSLSERDTTAKASIEERLEQLFSRTSLFVWRDGEQHNLANVLTLLKETAMRIISFMAAKVKGEIPHDWQRFEDDRISPFDNLKILDRQYESELAHGIFKSLCLISSLLDVSFTCTKWSNTLYTFHGLTELLDETDTLKRLEMLTKQKPKYHGQGVPGRCNFHEGKAFLMNLIKELKEHEEEHTAALEAHPELNKLIFSRFAKAFAAAFAKGHSYCKFVVATDLPPQMALAAESSFISLLRGDYNVNDGIDLKEVFGRLLEFVDVETVTQFIASYMASKIVFSVNITATLVSSSTAIVNYGSVKDVRKVLHFLPGTDRKHYDLSPHFAPNQRVKEPLQYKTWVAATKECLPQLFVQNPDGVLVDEYINAMLHVDDKADLLNCREQYAKYRAIACKHLADSSAYTLDNGVIYMSSSNEAKQINFRNNEVLMYIRTLIEDNYPNTKFTRAQLIEVSKSQSGRVLSRSTIKKYLKKLSSPSEETCPLKSHSYMYYIRRDANVEAGRITSKDEFEAGKEALILDCIDTHRFVSARMVVAHASAFPEMDLALTERYKEGQARRTNLRNKLKEMAQSVPPKISRDRSCTVHNQAIYMSVHDLGGTVIRPVNAPGSEFGSTQLLYDALAHENGSASRDAIERFFTANYPNFPVTQKFRENPNHSITTLFRDALDVHFDTSTQQYRRGAKPRP